MDTAEQEDEAMQTVSAGTERHAGMRGMEGREDRPKTTTAFQGSFTECKEQQLVFLLTRQLGAAQFEMANQAMTARLWQEVAALEIDPERITALLYGGHDINDREALRLLDEQWRGSHRPQRRGWFSRVPAPAGGHRSAPPAALRAHQPAR
jgi:hypothetical protein